MNSIPVYVVHSPRLRRRRAYLERVLQSLGWSAHWVLAFDPDEIPLAIRAASSPVPLRKGELSVYLKHLEVFRDILQRAYSVAFVLEDDPIFPEGFLARFDDYRQDLPDAYDMVFFGSSAGQEATPEPDSPRFAYEPGTRSMSAYLITGGCARVLLDALDGRPITAPIDLSINGIIRDRELRVYWSVPALVNNGSETGRFAHSLGVRWRQRTPVVRFARACRRLWHRVVTLAP